MLGQHTLDELLAERDKINEILQGIIDQQTEPWGVKVTVVEVKDVELPQGMQRAMARQAEAERERRAKIIGAEGEFEASEKLAQAAEVLSRDPAALQLRYLQTLLEISSGSNSTSTTIFPIPIDLLRPFAEAAQRYADGGGAPIRRRPRAAAAGARSAPSSPWDIAARPRLGDPGRLAPGRAHRPGAFAPPPPRPPRQTPDECPFCAGHEDQTPPADARAPRGGRQLGGARRAEPVPGARAAGRPERGRHPHARARHGVRRALAPQRSSARARRGRARAGARARPGWRSLLCSVNDGPGSGASLDHTHSQLTATLVRAAARRGAASAGSTAGCPVCAELGGARRGRRGRVEEARRRPRVYAPWASALPYQLRAAPLEHASDGLAAPDAARRALDGDRARLHRRPRRRCPGTRGCTRVRSTRDEPACTGTSRRSRVSTVLASIELGAGLPICTIEPEAAARALRARLTSGPSATLTRQIVLGHAVGRVDVIGSSACAAPARSPAPSARSIRTTASVPSSPSSSSSGCSATSATELSRSPSRSRMHGDALRVAAHAARCRSTLVRVAVPLTEISITCWLSRTTMAPASLPRLSTSRIVSTPIVPRPLRGYSSTGVRLP